MQHDKFLLGFLISSLFLILVCGVVSCASADSTPTPEVIVIEYNTPEPSATPELTPPPTPVPTPTPTFEIRHYEMPEELEEVCYKILWWSPILSEKSNPNVQKFGLLWVIANEYQCTLVINSAKQIVEFTALQPGESYEWLFPKDPTFKEIMMRPGDHEWYANCERTDQPWHKSETNTTIIHLWYDIWQSEMNGLNSGRTVPRSYIYYAFTPNSSGVCRNIKLYESKEDLINDVGAFTWDVVGVLDK